MTTVMLPDIIDHDDFENFLKWMEKNIGKFGKEWSWFNISAYTSKSVKVQNPKKAILVALRWG
jgi:hypothetical protein